MSCQCEILSSILQRERKKLLKITGMWVSFGAFNACFVCVKYCCLEAQNDPHKKMSKCASGGSYVTQWWLHIIASFSLFVLCLCANESIKSSPLSQQYAVVLVHSFYSCNGRFVYVCFVCSTFFFFFRLFTIILSFISVEICHRRTSILFEFPTGKKTKSKKLEKSENDDSETTLNKNVENLEW